MCLLVIEDIILEVEIKVIISRIFKRLKSLLRVREVWYYEESVPNNLRGTGSLNQLDQCITEQSVKTRSKYQSEFP